MTASNAANNPPPAAPSAPTGRLASIDAFRGFVMLLMMGEALEFGRVAANLPGSKFWALLAQHQSHVSWLGCNLHDLIQPSFSFLVGVAVPFSLARRAKEGEPQWRRTLHAFWRALLLILLGVFLRSVGHSQANWTFEDTLSQIGLGYGFLYLLALRSPRVQWGALAAVLIGYWLAFALYPLPGQTFDFAKAGIQADSPGQLAGFAAHWNRNTNPAWAFDTWFLNRFPREHAFTNNGGGYSTLSFIPTLGTMILGLLAGGVLRGPRTPAAKTRWLAIAGVAGLVLGWGLELAGLCPIVKRIWTPSWVLFSGGWACLFLAGFYQVIDLWNRRAWAFPLVVVGMNSIAAYLIAHLFANFIGEAWTRHAPAACFLALGKPYEPFVFGFSVLLTEWALLWWMYRRKLFLKI
jgi:heparan-alpha-glucosaminide N-acetyltransferase